MNYDEQISYLALDLYAQKENSLSLTHREAKVFLTPRGEIRRSANFAITAVLVNIIQKFRRI